MKTDEGKPTPRSTIGIRQWAWWILLVLAIALGFWRLRFDVDILNLLPPDEPTVQGLKLYQKHFTNARELVISVRAPDAELAEKFAMALANRLRHESNLVESVLWQPPWMEQPGQMAELLGCLWFNQPPAQFGTLTNRLAPGNLKALLANAKEALTTSMSPMDLARRAFDPFDLLNMPALNNLDAFSSGQGQQMFASARGDFRLLFVQSAVDLSGYRECASWLESIRAVVAREREVREPEPAGKGRWDGVVVRCTGRPVFVNEIATNMQRDMRGSVFGTSAIIAFLFWLTHRRWLPMLWLLALLLLVLLGTLGLGGLVLGTVSVMSMGFAAVLLGLAVDYAVVHYQEALAHPNLSVPEIRRAIAPSILWAAITTISAFLVLNFSGLPGLGQLGSLVAIGVGLAALVMVMIYLPPLFPDRRRAPPNLPRVGWWTFFIPASLPPQSAVPGNSTCQRRIAIFFTFAIAVFCLAVLSIHRPGLDKSGDSLRPQHGEAESALAEISAQMGLPPEPYWLIVSGSQEIETYRRLTNAEAALNLAISNRLIASYLLPTAMWPRAEFQAENRATAATLAQCGPLLKETALSEGFNTNALVLTDELMRLWARAAASTNVVWPTNDVSRWLLRRFVARAPNQWLVMGLIYPATNQVESSSLNSLSTSLAGEETYLSGWKLLAATTLKRMKSKLWQVVTPMIILVMASLWFAFRRSAEILLGAAALLLSGLFLLTVMSLAGWSWNLLNMMAVPLVLGTGVDYGIFMQLALRRHGGDLTVARRSIGRALMLCGGTAIAGFSSLAWSSNPGMASLGKVCAVGIGANMLIAVFLLPYWWKTCQQR